MTFFKNIKDIFKTLGPVKYVVLGGVVLVIGLVVYKTTGLPSTNNKQEVVEEDITVEYIVENLVQDTLPEMGNIVLTTKYEGTPFAMEATTYSIGNTSYMYGRSAVDPKDNAFNNGVEQYIEKIGNISTFYTLNPHADTYNYETSWIKETLATTDKEQGFSSFASIIGDLEDAEINEDTKSDSYSVYLVTGTLSAEKFPKYFYNIFGSTETECKVSVTVDKTTGYIAGVQFESTNKGGDLENLIYTLNLKTPTKNEQIAELDVPENVRTGGAEEGCLLFYIKDEANNNFEQE